MDRGLYFTKGEELDIRVIVRHISSELYVMPVLAVPGLNCMVLNNAYMK